MLDDDVNRIYYPGGRSFRSSWVLLREEVADVEVGFVVVVTAAGGTEGEVVEDEIR